jgi:hypothetical protein
MPTESRRQMRRIRIFANLHSFQSKGHDDGNKYENGGGKNSGGNIPFLDLFLKIKFLEKFPVDKNQGRNANEN